MLKEFKTFIMRGNVLDLAVAVIIGAAFSKIIDSLVSDIIMPPIGKVIGNINFKDLFVTLGPGTYRTLEEAKAAGAATINYGLFLNALINFLILAFAIFLLVRYAMRLKKKEPEKPKDTRECPFCMREISLRATRCPECTSQIAAA